MSEILKTEPESSELESGKITKARRHVSQNEGLIFEKSAPGKRGIELPPLDVPAVDAASELGKARKRVMPAARAKISAAAKRRWAKVRAGARKAAS